MNDIKIHYEFAIARKCKSKKVVPSGAIGGQMGPYSSIINE